MEAHRYLWSVNARYRVGRGGAKRYDRNGATIFYIEDDTIAVDFALRFHE